MFRIFFSTYPFRVRLPSFYGFGKEVAGFLLLNLILKILILLTFAAFLQGRQVLLCAIAVGGLTFAFCFEFANAFFLWVFLMFCSSSQKRCFLVATKGTCRDMLCSSLPRNKRRSLAWQQLTDITSGIEASRFPGQCVTKRPTVIWRWMGASRCKWVREETKGFLRFSSFGLASFVIMHLWCKTGFCSGILGVNG